MPRLNPPPDLSIRFRCNGQTFLTIIGCLLTLVATAQRYPSAVRHRTVFWSEINAVYKLPGKWSLQIDHQYRRQADDNNGRDLNAFRHPLLQVFRPWVSYQLSKPVRLSLSPIGLWWNWGRTNEYQPITFTQEVRIIPQLQITKPAGDGELIQRFRTEFRWPSLTDTLANAYIFLADGESQRVLADRFNLRLRAMLRWINPIFKRNTDDKRWYSHLSVEPMLVVADAGAFFDQNRTYLALGRQLAPNLRLELGYLNQFTIQMSESEALRLHRFNHALHVFVYFENRRRSQAGSDSGPEED
ncbi:DUF2490 domain-containing protein [Spirosoma sp. KUDC1026]|uniref:DUF2490 domain-containing protein n=1 Tax=Spirosoma sp. KUDC1026 TaxID=2745947 RepID=UPI00159B966D|nr:DUF2490 domain-containing protein [Spirosoma sp. KUDC1026]QKZ13047.1 DUF2490 domain-containing protein [Spirosoma sp. KUDC1026]